MADSMAAIYKRHESKTLPVSYKTCYITEYVDHKPGVTESNERAKQMSNSRTSGQVEHINPLDERVICHSQLPDEKWKHTTAGTSLALGYREIPDPNEVHPDPKSIKEYIPRPLFY